MATELPQHTRSRPPILLLICLSLLGVAYAQLGAMATFDLSLVVLFVASVVAAGRLFLAPLPGLILVIAISSFVRQFVSYGEIVGPMLTLIGLITVIVVAIVRGVRLETWTERPAARLGQLCCGGLLLGFSGLGVAQINNFGTSTDHDYRYGSDPHHTESGRLTMLAPVDVDSSTPLTLGVFWPSTVGPPPDGLMNILFGESHRDLDLPVVKVSGPDGPIPLVVEQFRDPGFIGYFRAEQGAHYEFEAEISNFFVIPATINGTDVIWRSLSYCLPVAAVGILMILSARRRGHRGCGPASVAPSAAASPEHGAGTKSAVQ